MVPVLWSLRSRLLILGVAIGVLGLVVSLAIATMRDVGQRPTGITDARIERLSSFSLPNLDGEPLTIDAYANGPVFIYFWASWCAPCEAEAPLIQRLWGEYRDAGYTFIGVNILDTEQGARRFVDRHGITFPVLLDSELYIELGVYGVPESFFLSPGLQVEAKYLGELTEPELRRLLAAVGSLTRVEP